ALDESLNVAVGAVPREERRDQEDEEKRGQKDPDSCRQRAAEAGTEITHKRRRNHDRARTDHADGDSHQEVALAQPAVLLHDALLQEGHDDKTAAKSKRAGL